MKELGWVMGWEYYYWGEIHSRLAKRFFQLKIFKIIDLVRKKSETTQKENNLIGNWVKTSRSEDLLDLVIRSALISNVS